MALLLNGLQPVKMTLKKRRELSYDFFISESIQLSSKRTTIENFFNPTHHGVFGDNPVTGGGQNVPPIFFWVALFDGVFL